MNKTFDFVIAVIVLILTSCSDRVSPDSESGHAISFSLPQIVSIEKTKAFLYENDNIIDDKQNVVFSLISYKSGSNSLHFLSPERIHWQYYPSAPERSTWSFYDGSRLYNRYWPKTYALDFFAYMPYDLSGSGMTIDSGSKEISCELPIDRPATEGNEAQNSTAAQSAAKEFVYAYSPDYTYETENGNVGLNFIHPVSAIYFKLGEAHGNTVIHSVGLSRLHNTGTLNVSQNLTQNDLKYSDWNIPDGATRGDMTISINKTVGGSGSQGIQLNSPIGGPYLVMPQATATPVSTEDIDITVSFTWNGTKTDARVKLGGDGWKPGYKYTYTLTLGDNEEDILANVHVVPWNEVEYKNNIEIE